MLGGAWLGQTARNVLVENAGDKGLVRHAFFKRLDLNVTQIAGGQADVDPAILNGCGTRGCFEFGKLAFGSNGPKLAFLIGTEDFKFVGVSFRHLFHLDSNSPSLPCSSGLWS